MQIPIDHARIEAARRLYIKYEGKQLKLLEREMRSLGYDKFHRRILHSRFERGHHRPGWIERYGFAERSPTAETPSRGETKEFLPQIAADIADLTEANLSASDPRHLRTSAAKTLPPRLDVSAEDSDPNTFDSDFDHFQHWLKEVSPEMTWTWKHQVHIYKRLKRVSDGLCKRLMIFLPPRHGKSELVTVRYTAWRMKQDPKMNVILGSYNQRLANRFSRKIKKVLMDDYALGSGGVEESGSGGDMSGCAAMQCGGACLNNHSHICHKESAERATEAAQINGKIEGCRPCTCKETSSQRPGVSAVNAGSVFPFVSTKGKNTESEWETAVGGGLRAVGVGGGITGFGANLIVIDDPVRSRADAESAKMRERVWHWFNDDIYTRLEPGGSIVLIQTRWHEDDLAGRLLREPVPEGGEQWKVVNLPALAEEKSLATESTEDTERESISANVDSDSVIKKSKTASPSSDWRAPGEALCPSRYDEDYFHQLREKIGSYSFASLYQQRPVPAEGGMFKRKWFENNIISAAPPDLRWKRGTDPGVSAGEKADYSASVRIAIGKDGNMYIADMFRRQVEYPELRRFIAERLKQERDVEHGIELAGHGPAIYQDLVKNGEAQGRAFRGIKITDPKMARALPWLALAEAGKVYLVRGHWNEEFMNEAASFPMGTHDDQIDAVSLAFELATAKSRKSYGF